MGGSGREWDKVVESGGKWGEAKVHRDHPGWFSAVRAPLGSPLRSTCPYLHTHTPPPIHYLTNILSSGLSTLCPHPRGKAGRLVNPESALVGRAVLSLPSPSGFGPLGLGMQEGPVQGTCVGGSSMFPYQCNLYI